MTTPSTFLNRIVITPNCWEWAGETRLGYGRLYYQGRKLSAHRVAYKLFIGDFNEELEVCHHCDNPSCVNPNHLFLGHHIDNMRDMVAKGRAPCNVGIKNPNAKLVEENVTEVRRRYKEEGASIAALAREFNVTSSNMSDIVHNKTWKHVKESV